MNTHSQVLTAGDHAQKTVAVLNKLYTFRCNIGIAVEIMA